jgi:membrane protease YdiL (CAAX protease family)
VLSPKPWKLEAVLRLALGVFLCLFIGTLLSLLVREAGDAKSPVTVRKMIVSAICFQGVSIALVWRFVREHGIGWAEAFGFRNHRNRALVLGGLVICTFMPIGWMLQRASIALMERLGVETVTQQAVEALQNAGHGMGLVVFVVVTVIVAPVAEELLFRGVLYPAIKSAGFPRLALWGSSALFAAIHTNLPIFLPLLVLALVLVWLYEQTDNLLAPIAAHALFNATNLVLFFTFPTRLSGPP